MLRNFTIFTGFIDFAMITGFDSITSVRNNCKNITIVKSFACIISFDRFIAFRVFDTNWFLIQRQQFVMSLV